MNSAKVGVLAVVFMLLVTGYGCFGPPGTAACAGATGFGPAMFESVQACPRAVEQLGSPVRLGLMGVGCGNYEAGGDVGDGLAQGSGSIVGPKGSADVTYVLSKGGGQWQSSVLVLTFADGSKVDVKACTESLEVQRGAEALLKILSDACEQGQAAQCEGLASQLEAKRDGAGAKAAREKACKLGLASSCR